MLAGITLDGETYDPLGLFLRPALGVLHDMPAQRVSVPQGLQFDTLEQSLPGFGLGQTRRLLQLPTTGALNFGQLSFSCVKRVATLAQIGLFQVQVLIGLNDALQL